LRPAIPVEIGECRLGWDRIDIQRPARPAVHQRKTILGERGGRRVGGTARTGAMDEAAPSAQQLPCVVRAQPEVFLENSLGTDIRFANFRLPSGCRR
jgi:hypothetical protein